MAIGDIGGVLASLEFDPAGGIAPNIIHVSGDVYVIAYQGPDDDGWLKTVTIGADGTISAVVGGSLEFDGVDATFIDILHVTGDIYVIAYRGPDGDGWLKTVTIDSEGDIAAVGGGSLEFDGVAGVSPRIIHVSGDIYAIAYRGAVGNDGWVKTVPIDSEGAIGAVIDSLEYDVVGAATPWIIHVTGDIYAITYRDEALKGWIKTVDIDAAGQIGDAVIDSQEYEANAGGFSAFNSVVPISGTVYAIAYQSGGDDGWIKTFTVESNGTIGSYTSFTTPMSGWRTVGQATWEAHGFIPLVSHQIIAIKLLVYQSNGPGTVTVSIRATSGELPTGGDLASGSFDGNAVADSAPGEVVTVLLGAGTPLSGGTKYAIVVRAPDAPPGPYKINWREMNDTTPTDQYPDGKGVYSLNSGVNWSQFAGEGVTHFVDRYFEEGDSALFGILDSLEFDGAQGALPWIIPVLQNVYAIAYQGPDDDGWLKTVTIDSDGTIGSVDSLEFDEAKGAAPCIIHVTGNIYAIAYQGPDDHGWVKTVDISTPTGMRGLGPGAMAKMMGV